MTVEISDSLLREVRKLAERDGVTQRAPVERGLIETESGAPFTLRHASFKGNGLQAHARSASWSGLCGLAYAGRGP